MNPQTDRREISRLLLPHFPHMEGADSDAWHGFLDGATGLTTPQDEVNSTAFDRWRQALDKQGYPVWGYSPDKAQQVAAGVAELLQKEAQRLADEPALLAALAKEAPLVTAAELLKAK